MFNSATIESLEESPLKIVELGVIFKGGTFIPGTYGSFSCKNDPGEG